MTEIKILPSSEWAEGKEGFFAGLGEEAYRAADGLSQSQLKVILRSPACLEQGIRYPQIPTWPMQVGTIAHAAILDPASFGDGKSHYVQPDTYEADDSRTKKEIAAGVPYVAEIKPWNSNSVVCKSWIRAHSNKPNLSLEEHQTILAMKNQFHGDEFGSMFAKKGYGEVAIFSRDPETGIMLKGRLDLFAFANGLFLIGDLKVCADGDEFEFRQQCARMLYHVQTAAYLDLVNNELRRQGIVPAAETRFLHCTIENKRPHFLEWRELDQEAIHKGRVLYRQAIGDYVRAQETGFFSVIRPVSLPKWAAE